MMLFKTYLLSNMPILGIHVSFRGCNNFEASNLSCESKLTNQCFKCWSKRSLNDEFLPETNAASLHLKMSGWRRGISSWGLMAYFQGLWLAVSFREFFVGGARWFKIQVGCPTSNKPFDRRIQKTTAEPCWLEPAPTPPFGKICVS